MILFSETLQTPDIENFWGKTTSFTKFLEARGGI